MREYGIVEILNTNGVNKVKSTIYIKKLIHEYST